MDGPTFGIEEEYLLVDASSGDLVARAPEVLASGRSMGERLSAELNRCQVEIATGICGDLGHAERELTRLRQEATAAGAAVGALPAALGSHPWSSWYDQEINTDKDRYVRLEETYRRVAWQQAICGCHVHVGVPDRDLRIEVMNRARPWLPVLLALSANSPYWEGSDSGYDSYRSLIWQSWPTTGMPPPLASWAAYEAMVGELEAVEAIETPKSLYWYVRPSDAFDTVEFRVLDVCLRVEDAITVAGLIRGLVTACVADAERGRPYDAPSAPVLQSALWRAARYGLDHVLVDPEHRALRPAADVVGRLVEHVRPAIDGTADAPRLLAGVDEILRRGNGSTAQRTLLSAPEPPERVMGRLLGEMG
jgi:carboxylate-amine ligase